MDAGAVNTAGGICELAGLGLVVREYIAALQHEGWPDAVRRRLEELWRRIVAWSRRVRGRQGEAVDAHAQGAMASAAAMNATAQVIPGKFAPHAGQSVEDQVAQLGRVVNRLIDWISDELQQRDQAIKAARADAQAELQAESRRLRDLISEVERALQDLDQRTTGDLRLRLDGLWLLLVGIVFTTWPDLVAEHVLGWLPWPYFYFVLVSYVAWRLVASTTGALRSN